jgi:F-type H+-transporting ATPase subunit b
VRGISSLASAGLLLMTSSAFAEEAQKGMPQLDFANPLTISQVVWLAVIFFALYLLLSRWALPQVASVLEDRAKKISADLEAAGIAKAQSEAALVEMKITTAKAQAEAMAQVNAAVDAAKAEAAVHAVASNAKLEAQLAAAETRIAAARAAAVGALHEVATTTTGDLFSRLSGFSPDPAAIDSAVGRALAARAA